MNMKQLSFDGLFEAEGDAVQEPDGASDTAEPVSKPKAASTTPSAQNLIPFECPINATYRRAADRADTLAADAVGLGHNGISRIVKPG